MAFLFLAVAFSLVSKTFAADACINMSFDFYSEQGRCSYADVIEKIQQILNKLKSNSQECPHDAFTELNMHFNKGTNATKKKIDKICNKLRLDQFPWGMVTGRGKRFDKTYFAGHGPWNTEVETSRYGEHMYRLREDASRVKDVYQSFAKTTSISWPEHVEFLADCPLRAVTCCMVGDRQANDNNGNCATPYNKNCVNSVPADNTQVCSVNGTKKLPFLGDQQEAIHCHSFTWSSDKLDQSFSFRGNKLFYTSMYDHLFQRGYVKNIPGAPMCGCVESMPVVTRSDCTEVDVRMKFRFEPSPAGARISFHSSDVDFNSCQGADNNNNDLYFYYKKLARHGRATVEELIKLRKFILGGNSPTCSDGDSDSDAILAQVVGDSKDAQLVKIAILYYAVENRRFPGMQDGGFYMLRGETRRLAAHYLGMHLGLKDEALSEYLDAHFLDVWNERAHPQNARRFVKVIELPDFMNALVSFPRRLLMI